MSKEYTIALIPGDGIGKEVIPEGTKVLQAAAEETNVAGGESESHLGGAVLVIPGFDCDTAFHQNQLPFADVSGSDFGQFFPSRWLDLMERTYSSDTMVKCYVVVLTILMTKKQYKFSVHLSLMSRLSWDTRKSM